MNSKTNFGRTYVMKIGERGKQGFVIGNTKSATQDVLHICFSIEKSDSSSSNTAKVQIWNLSKDHLKILDKKDLVLYLNAGYGDNRPLILAGNITSVTTTQDGADRLTELEVVDGRVAIRDTYVSVSKNKKVNCKDLYKDISNQMGLSIVFAKDVTFKTFPNGFSYVGKGKMALDKLTKACSHNWTIQNEVLQITNKGKPLNSYGYLLSAETGLVEIPKKITISSSDSSDSESQTGWEIKYFLNGAIGVNDVVKLKTDVINGNYRIYKVTMDGDNVDSDWMCTAQIVKAD